MGRLLDVISAFFRREVMEQSVDLERQKIVVSSSVQKYKVDEFPGAYACYIESRHMDNIGLQFASGIVVAFGLVLFLHGFYIRICEPILNELSPDAIIISGALMMLIGGVLRWLWNPKSAAQFFLENYSFVGEDGEDLSGKVSVEHLGKGMFRLKRMHSAERASVG